MAFREIDAAVVSDRIIHRVERMPGWQSTEDALPWRSLCGVAVGRNRGGGRFEFEVAVALDPEAWRLAANCTACRVATERRALGALR